MNDNDGMDFSNRVTINVGGKIFTTTVETLASLPNTRLGRLATGWTLTGPPDVEPFFDRNPKIVNSLLDLYRTGELHLPPNLCGSVATRELDFWGVPTGLVQECCVIKFIGLLECQREGQLEEITKKMD